MSRNKKSFNYELANQIHNNKYDYSKVVYTGVKDKVEIICPIHGSFWQCPDDHINKGRGCPKCKNEKLRGPRKNIGKQIHTDSPTLTKEEFLTKTRELYGDKYEYPELPDIIHYRKKIKIICPIHGEFELTPYMHLLRNKGCAECNKRIHSTTEKFIKNAIKVHGNKYDYSKVEYKDSITPVCIICPTHGEFWQKPNLHISSHCGCPKCRQSHGEEEIYKYFKSKNIVAEEWKTMDNPYNKSGYMFADFYLEYKNNKYIIEFNGKQHYEYSPIFHVNGIEDFYKQQLRDQNLRKLCKERNIILIEISYKQMKLISNILDKYFN